MALSAGRMAEDPPLILEGAPESCPFSERLPRAARLGYAAPAVRSNFLLLALALGTCLAHPSNAAAHVLNKSFVDLKTTPAGAEGIFDFDTADLVESLGARLDSDGSGRVEEQEASHHRALLEHLAGEGLLLDRGDAACAATLSAPFGFSRGMVRTRLHFTCPAAGAHRLRVPLLDRMRPDHKTFLVWRDGEALHSSVLDRAQPTWQPPGEHGAWATGLRYLTLGVEHILLGYDHLLFLFALVLAARRLKELVAIVTSFTVAHSITLALAGLGLVSLSPRLVEPAIAVTIIYVGLENLWSRAPRRRWLLTFFLGLVHGFGFAGLLQEIGLPAEAQGLALFAFNLGVELGQVAMVLAVAPGLLLLRRDDLSPRARLALAAGGLALASLMAFFVPWAAVGLAATTLGFVLLIPRWGYERVALIGASCGVVLLGLVFFAARLLPA